MIYEYPLASISFLALSAMFEASIAYTFLAPAYAAKRDNMPEPHPTSITILSWKSALLLRMAFL